MKRTVFGVLTASWIIAAGLVIWAVTRTQTYTGTDVTFYISDNRYMVIDAAVVTMEVADGEFFALREEGGETIVGESQPKPLGWSSENYFKAEPREVPGGKWVVEKASGATVHLTSEDDMAIEIVMYGSDQAVSTVLLVMMFLVVWLVSLSFMV